MYLNLKNLSKLGFKGTFMTGNTSISLLWRVKGNRVEFTSGYTPNMLGYFTLTPRQLKSFNAGKLSLVPTGFCNATGGESLTEHIILHTGPVKSCKQVEEIFAR